MDAPLPFLRPEPNRSELRTNRKLTRVHAPTDGPQTCRMDDAFRDRVEVPLVPRRSEAAIRRYHGGVWEVSDARRAL